MQPGAVDHAADVSVHPDEAQSGRRGLALFGQLLFGIAPGADIGVAGEGVVVEIDLGVGGDERPGRREDERIDLEEKRVGRFGGAGETPEDPDGLLERRAGEAQGPGGPLGLDGEEAFRWRYRLF